MVLEEHHSDRKKWNVTWGWSHPYLVIAGPLFDSDAIWIPDLNDVVTISITNTETHDAVVCKQQQQAQKTVHKSSEQLIQPDAKGGDIYYCNY